jgi:hypothetical protein
MGNASSYEEWREAAEALDKLEGNVKMQMPFFLLMCIYV